MSADPVGTHLSNIQQVEETAMHAGSRLVDEFRAEAAARGIALPGELDVNGSFADLDPWPPDDDGADGVVERCERDPAFKVTGYSRWVVFARVRDEIRYYAAALPGLRGDPARDAAIRAEPDESEMAIVATVADAVTLAVEYLNGKALREIGVRKLPPPWGFPDPEPAAEAG